jgi:hypothetical protein
MTTVFLAMTLSPGMPVFFFLAFLTLLLMYWVDKILLLRFYRLTPGFTHHLSRAAVAWLPYAAVCHLFVGIFVFSYPNLLSSLK